MEGDGAVVNVALVFTKDEQVSIIAGINSGWGQAFEIDVKAIRESKGHNKELQNVARVIDSNLSDSTLERYLKDFQEQNIKIFPAFTLSERIEFKALMNSLLMVIANNGHVLIGGNNGALYLGVFDEQGK